MSPLPPGIDPAAYNAALAQVIEKHARQEQEERAGRLHAAKARLLEADKAHASATSLLIPRKRLSPFRHVTLLVLLHDGHMGGWKGLKGAFLVAEEWA